MQYKNAIDVLPSKLLEELQKYAAGTLLYIPNNEEAKSWGEVSGYRAYLIKRNQMIYNRFQYGEGISTLSDRFGLSSETIKKIVYSKKKVPILSFEPTSESAREHAELGLLEEWIHTYLVFERKNQTFSDGLYQVQRYYQGPIQMSIIDFERSSGPEAHMKWVVDEEGFERKVKGWLQKIAKNESLPPLIINYTVGIFEVNCNNPLLEALKRSNQTMYPVILWFSSKVDYEHFNGCYEEGLGID